MTDYQAPPPPPMDGPEPPRRYESEEPYYSGDPAYAAKKINIPAICLMVTALISALFCVYVIIMNIVSSPEQNIESMREVFRAMDMPVDEAMLQQYAGGNIVLTIVMWGGFLLIDMFLFYAAMRMRQLKGYGMSMGAAIVATIPCCWSACCILNVPFGIWLLVVLRDPEVKAAFDSY